MSEESLKDKTIKGVGWSFIDNFSSLGISFVVGIILARLLSPDEYGLIGILTIFISIFNFIVDSGFTNALIRKKNATEDDYCTVFYVNLAVSMFMSLLLFLGADLIAQFFKRPELISLTRVMASIIVINALAIVQKVRLTKSLDFKTQTKVTIFSTTFSGIVGVVMAINGFGVWSLVFQQITARTATTILLWIFNKWIPSKRFSKQSFKELWGFGWKLLVSGLIDSLWAQIYQVIIGRFYTPTTLGLYTRAKQFSDLCSVNLTVVVQRVSFPMLSNIQDDIVRLKSAYQKVIKCTMLVTFVLMIGMAVCAESMISVLIGYKWLDCVPILQIVCLSSMLYPLHAINLNMLQVQGRSDLFLKLEIIKKFIGLVPLLLGIFIDIYWMLAGGIITSVIAFFLNAGYSGPFLKYSIKEQVKDIFPSFGIAMAMAVPVFAISFIPMSPYIMLPLQIVVGTIITVSICEATKLPEYLEIKGIAMPIVNKIIKRKKSYGQ